MMRSARIRLSTMFFLEYLGMGFIYPVMSLYLRDTLHFTGAQTGAVIAMASIAAFIYPVAGAMLADRVIAKERLLAVCQIVSAVLLAVLAFQTRYPPVAVLYLCYNLAFGPTLALATAIAFHHLPGKRNYFGSVRVWGTIGWIAAAWLFGLARLCLGGQGRLRDAFLLSAASSVILAVHMLLHHPVERIQPVTKIIPWDALRVVAQRRVLFIAVVMFLGSFFIRFYYMGFAPFLAARGLRQAFIMPLMSLGQMSEIAAMSLLAVLVPRLGFKRMLMLGAGLALVQSALFSANAAWPFIVAGIVCHGLIYALINVTALMHVDSFCPAQARAGVHQILALLSTGFATLAGSLASGWALDWATRAGVVDYHRFWLVSAGVASLLLALVTLFSSEPETDGDR